MHLFGCTKTKELKICLHDLGDWDRNYLRYESFNGLRTTKEMFFITRGNEELLPCDNNYNPLTTDTRYTLHKRSRLLTVEGYITFENDTAEFFERNSRVRWRVADLGEFDSLEAKYKRFVMEKLQGIYLKELAYTVVDTVLFDDKEALVIKEIKAMNNDPDYSD
jgi:hypothetical protein